MLIFKTLCENDRQFNNLGISFTVNCRYIFISDTDPTDKLDAVRKQVFFEMSEVI